MRSLRLQALLALAVAGFLTSFAFADVAPTDRFELSGAYVARHVEDRNNVAVVELGGNYDRALPSGNFNAEPRAVVAREFFRTHPDDYDFLVVFSSFEFKTGDALAFCVPVRNDVRGIGITPFDNSDLYGSSRLRGYIDMAALSRYSLHPLEPEFEIAMRTLAHEVLHVWGPKIRFRKDDVLRDDLIGKDDSHWSYLLDNGGSVQYGARWRDNGNGTFTSTAARTFYSPLDLYLMGLLGKEEVPPFYLINNPQISKTNVNEVNETISGTKEQVAIDDVIAAEGARVPDTAHAQKNFRIAFVLLVPPGEAASAQDIASINAVRDGFATRFAAMTGGRAIVQALPRTLEQAETGAPDTVGSEEEFANGQGVNEALQWLQSRQQNGAWTDKPATRVRDTIDAYSTLLQYAPFFSGATDARNWLAANPGRNTDYLARYAGLLRATGASDAANQIQQLRQLQNADGGWGLGKGFASNPLDTALALQALATTTNTAEIAKGVQYLIGARQADAGWGNSGKGASRLHVTFEALAALRAVAAAADTRTSAMQWLTTQQHGDGGFGDQATSTTHDTANAILAFVAERALDKINGDAAARFVLGQQRRDGSWDGSVHATARAVAAIKNFTYPNWALTSLTAEPSSVVDGARVTLRAIVTNTSATPASPTTLAVHAGDPAGGGQRIELVSVPPLGPGVAHEVTVYWDSLDRAGQHTFHAIVDPDNSNLEVTRADNTATLPLTVQPAPAEADLEVATSAVLVTPVQPASLPTPLSFLVQVRNLGQAAASNVAIRLFVVEEGAERLVAEEFRDLQGRSTVPVGFSYELRSAGPVRFVVRVDADGTVAETNEQNNAATLDVATQPTIDLTVAASDIEVPQSAVFAGQDINFRVTLHNHGTLASPSAKVHFRISGAGQTQELTPVELAIPAGGEVQHNLVWRADLTGDITLSVIVDPEGKVPEQSEANNTAQATFVSAPFVGANLVTSYQDFVLTPVPANEGAGVQLRAEIANTGLVNADNVSVAFYNGDPQQGGSLIGSTVLPVVAAGGKATAVFDWTAVPDGADKLLFVVVDPDNAVTEFRKDDNSTFNILPVNSLPDLAVTSGDIAFTPTVPRAGQTVAVRVHITNFGEQAASNVPVRVKDMAGNLVQETTLVALGAKADTTLTLAWTPASGTGEIGLTVEIDPQAQRPERVRDNNVASHSFTLQNANFYVNESYISPNGDGVQDNTEFFYTLTTADSVRIEVAAADGTVARSESRAAGELGGSYVWNGLDNNGAQAKDGEYDIRLYGSQGLLGKARVVVDTNHTFHLAAAAAGNLLSDNLTCGAVGNVFLEYTWNEIPGIGQSLSRVRPVLTTDGSSGSGSGRTQPSILNFDWSVPQAVPLVQDGQKRFRLIGTSHDANTIYYSRWNLPDTYSAGSFDSNWRLDVATRTSTQITFPANHYFRAITDNPNVLLMQRSTPDWWVPDPFVFYDVQAGTLRDLPLPGYVDQYEDVSLISVSPDHKRALLRFSYHGMAFYEFATGAITELSSGGYDFEWSPDLKKIVFYNGGGNGNMITVVSVEDGSHLASFPSAVPNASWDSGYVDIAWSHDSKRIAFLEVEKQSNSARTRDGVFGLLDIDSGRRHEVAPISLMYFEDGAGPAKREAREAEILSKGMIPLGIERNVGELYFVSTLRAIPNEPAFILGSWDWSRVEDWHAEDSTYPQRSAHLIEDALTLNARPIKLQSLAMYYWDVDSLVPFAIGSEAGHVFYTNFAGPDCIREEEDDIDLWELRNLSNLTAVLKARVRAGSGIRLSGIAQDANFASYRLEYSAFETPDSWHPIVTAGTSAVVNDMFALWAPPTAGKYNVRLTVTDKAGNSRSASRVVSWAKPVPITDIYRDLDLFSPNGDGVKDAVTLHYRVLEPTHVTTQVYDSKGLLVRDLSRDHSVIGEEVNLLWDGRDGNGRPVADGVYTLRVNNVELRTEVDNTPPAGALAYLPLLQEVVDEQDASSSWVSETPFLVEAAPAGATLQAAHASDDWAALLALRSVDIQNGGTRSRLAFMPHDLRNRRIRTVLEDKAGNRNVVALANYAEQLVLSHVYKPLPETDLGTIHPMQNWSPVPFFRPGQNRNLVMQGADMTLLLQHTLALPTVAVQAQITANNGSGVAPADSQWQDIPASFVAIVTSTGYEPQRDRPEAVPVTVPAPAVDLSVTRNYLIRLTLVDTQGRRFVSNPVPVVFTSDAIMARYCGTAPACNGQPYALYFNNGNPDQLAEVELQVGPDGGTLKSWGAAALRDVSAQEQRSFFFNNNSSMPLPSRAWVGGGDLEACKTYDVRFKGFYKDGRAFEHNTRLITPCLKLEVKSVAAVPAAECGVEPPKKQRFDVDVKFAELTPQGQPVAVKPALKLMELFRLRADGSEDVLWSSNTPSYGAMSFELGDSAFAAGTHRAMLRVTDVNNVAYEADASFLVDRKAPTLAIAYPAEGQKVCRTTEVNGELWDDSGVAFEPALQQQSLKAVSGTDAKILKASERGGDFSLTVGEGSGLQQLSLKALDKGGYRVCASRQFEIDGLALRNAVRLSTDRTPRGFSPNGDNLFDLLQVTYAPQEALEITTRVFQFLGNDLNGKPVVGQQMAQWTLNALGDGPLDYEWTGQGDGGSVLPDGDYLLQVDYRDGCGNTASEYSREFYLDTGKPVINLAAPQPNAPVGALLHTQGEVSDPHPASTTIAYLRGDATLASAVFKQTSTPAALVHNFNVPEQLDELEVVVTARDEVGNEQQVSVPLTVLQDARLVDSVEPAPALFSPNQDGRRETTTLSVAVKSAARLTVRVKDAAGSVVRTLLADSAAAAASVSHATWDGLADNGSVLADGLYQFEVTATAEGNAAWQQLESVAVELDRTAPVTALTQPAQPFVSKQAGVAGRIADPHFQSFRVLVAEEAPFPSWRLVEESESAQIAVPASALGSLADGAYRLRIEASDEAENIGYHEVAFTLDQAAPEVRLLAPVADSLLGKDPVVAISASIAESNLAYYEIALTPEGGAAEVITSGDVLAGQSLSAQLALAGHADGHYLLSVTARDKAGNSSTDKVGVDVDTTAPSVTIDAPEEGGFVREGVAITGQLGDLSLASYSIAVATEEDAARDRWSPLYEGSDFTATGAFRYQWDGLPRDGSYVLRVRAGDRVGLQGETRRVVHVDASAPATPQALAATVENGNTAHLTWNASASADVTGYRVYRDGQPVTGPPQQTTEFFDAGLADGRYSYTVAALDAAGWESEQTEVRSIAVDTTPPTILILAPANGGAINRNAVLTGTVAAQDDLKEYRVLYATDGGSWQLLARGATPVTAATLASLAIPGATHGQAYQLRVEAEDNLGNIASAQISVTIDEQAPGAPTLAAVIKTTGGGNDVALSWTAPAAGDIEGYLLFRDGQLVNGGRDMPAELRPYLLTQLARDDIDVADGVHTYNVQAMDRTGNLGTSSTPVELTIDIRAPHAVFVQPRSGGIYPSAIPVSVTVADEDLASVLLEYRRAGGIWGSLGTRTAASLLWTFDPVVLGLSYGNYELRATATDVRGRTDTAPSVVAITYRDTTPPELQNARVHVDGTAVQLSWDASTASDLAGYRIYRSTESGEQLLTSSLLSTTTYSLTEADGVYGYRIAAVDTYGNESRMSPLQARVYAPVLRDAYSPTLSATTAVSIKTPVAGAATVKVTHADGSIVSRSITLAANTAGTEENLPLQPGLNTLSVVVVDAEGNRSRTAEVIVLQGNAPAAPVNLQSAMNGDIHRLSWDANVDGNMLGYRVYRDGASTAADTALQIATVTPSMESWYPASNAADGNLNTWWVSYTTDLNPMLEFAWTGLKLVTRLEIFWEPGNPIPSEYDIQAWESVVGRWVVIASTQDNKQAYNDLVLPKAYVTSKLRLVVPGKNAAGHEQQIVLQDFKAWKRDLVTDTFFDETLGDGRVNYEVSAVNRQGFESPRSQPKLVEVGDVTAPPAVTLAGEVVSGEVRLSWPASAADDVAFYRVYRDGAEIASTASADGREFRESPESGTYAYQVAAVDQIGNEGARSNVVQLQIGDGINRSLFLNLLKPTVPGEPLSTTQRLIDVAGLTLPDTDVTLTVNGAAVGTARSQDSASLARVTFEEEVAPFQVSADADEVWYLMVSPDGRYTAMLSGYGEVKLRNRGSGEITLLETLAEPGSLEWSRDSRVLMYADEGGTVTTYELATGTKRRVTVNPGTDDIWNPIVSASGRRIALPYREGSGFPFPGQNTKYGMRLIDMETGDMRLVLTTTGFYWGQWSPDEQQLAVWYRWADQANVLDLQSGTRIAELPGVYSQPSWSPDGRTLVFSADEGVVAYDMATQQRRLLFPEWVNGYPQLLADGKTLGLLLDDNGINVVATLDTASNKLTRLISLDPDIWVDQTEWTRDGRVLLHENYWYASLQEVTLPGAVRLDNVPLQDGDNLISGTAFGAGGGEAVARPLLVTVTSDRPDLEITRQSVVVMPATPLQGENVRINVAVTNRGHQTTAATTMTLALLSPAGDTVAELQADVPVLVAGKQATIAFDATLPLQSGRYVLIVEADAAGRVLEASESNNTVIRELQVAGGTEPVLSLALGKTSYAFDEAVSLDVGLLLGEGTQQGTVQVDVTDADGYLVEQLLAALASIDIAHPYQTHLDWDTRAYYAGNYIARARWLAPDGSVRAEQQAAFTVQAEGRFTASVTADRAQYLPGSVVNLAGSALYVDGNQVVDGASARLRISDAGGTPVFEETRALGDWLKGATVQLDARWQPDNSRVGHYTVSFEVQRNDLRLAAAETAFDVLPVASLQGSLTLDGDVVDVDGRQQATYQLRNDGTAEADVTVRLQLVAVASGAVLAEAQHRHALAPSATVTGAEQLTLQGQPLQAYEVRLDKVASDGSIVGLDRKTFQVIDRLPPQLAILAPQTGSTADAAVVRLRVQAVDLHAPLAAIEYSVDGQAWRGLSPEDLETGLFVQDTAALTGGVHELRVRAVDAYGNSALSQVSVTVINTDTTPPLITVSGISDGGLYGAAVTPVVVVQEATEQTITLDGQTFVSGTAVDSAGNHTLQVQARDAAGNTATQNVSFVLDLDAPVVAVSGVTDGTHYAAAVTPTVVISDAHLASQAVTLDGASHVSGTAVTGEGSHVLQIAASDSVGHSTERTLTFTLDFTAPQIVVTGVSEGAEYAAAVTPVIAITDAALEQSTVTLNGEPFVSGTEVGTDGDYTLVVSARDQAGNTVTHSVSFALATPVVLAGELNVVPGEVIEGDSVLLSSVIANNGSQDVQMQVTLTVANQARPQDSTVLETSRTVAAGQSFTWVQSLVPAGTAGEQYSITLRATVSGSAYPLATGSFTMKSAAVQGDLQAGLNGPGSTLVMLGCNNGWPGFILGQLLNSCYDTRAQTLRSHFDSLGVSYRIVYSESDFRAQLRSGRYSNYWMLGEMGPWSDAMAKELREAVNRGGTLMVDGGFYSWLNWPLFDVAGAKFGGRLWFTRDEMQVDGPHFASTTLQTAGYHPLRLVQNGGTVEATYAGLLCYRVDNELGISTPWLLQPNGSYPAVITNGYGRGRAVVLAFDLVDSLRANPASADWARFLRESVDYLAPTVPLRHTDGEPVQVRLVASNSDTRTGSFTVKSQLPAGMTLLDSNVGATAGSNGQLSFNLDLAAGASRTVMLVLLTGTASGDYRMEFELYGNASSGAQLQERQSVVIPVRAWRDLYGDIDTALRALPLTSFSDKTLRTLILSDLQSSRTNYEWHLYDMAIAEMLEGITRLRQIQGADVQAIRQNMDTLLREYELGWRPGLF